MNDGIHSASGLPFSLLGFRRRSRPVAGATRSDNRNKPAVQSVSNTFEVRWRQG